ncbi:hypothetical protein [Streptomyces sp. NPDC102437]|uniref:hypothetical protein n=1 Tax=Streptomyces sp. NPDC102437 TaxID=3366175 RepID=UPI00380C4609
MAALLGAATLAIVLLYQGWKQNRQLITDLSAQVAAQRIAALTGAGIASSLADEPPEERGPARRKRHLVLYIGGGALAAVTVVRDRLRSLWQSHRVLTLTAAATVATVTTAAAFTMTASDNEPAEDRGHRPAAAAPDRNGADILDAPDRNPRGSRWKTPRDTQNGGILPADAAVDLITDEEQERAGHPEATPEPSASSHAPASDGGSGRPEGGAEEGTGGPSTPPTGQPEGPGTTEPTKPPEPVKPTKPASPAVLTVGTPRLADTDTRWCQNVTVDIRNTGGTTATSGTLRFGTHILGPLGVDWITIKQTRELPAPVPAGGHIEGSWTLCVDAWRVPVGFRIDTLDVEVTQN